MLTCNNITSVRKHVIKIDNFNLSLFIVASPCLEGKKKIRRTKTHSMTQTCTPTQVIMVIMTKVRLRLIPMFTDVSQVWRAPAWSAGAECGHHTVLKTTDMLTFAHLSLARLTFLQNVYQVHIKGRWRGWWRCYRRDDCGGGDCNWRLDCSRALNRYFKPKSILYQYKPSDFWS